MEVLQLSEAMHGIVCYLNAYRIIIS